MLAAVVVFTSCAFGDNADVVPTIAADEQIIYVAGQYNQHACVWIVNGTLSTRIMLDEIPSTLRSRASGLIVTDKGVITVGYCELGATYVHVMWVNGAVTQLSSLTSVNTSYTSAIVAYNGKPYVALTAGDAAYMWTDGVLIKLPLPAGATGSKAMGIAVENGHVVVGGEVKVGSPFYNACVWIDGACLVLDQSLADDTEIFSVARHNGHWYAAGTSRDTNIAALWIDGAYVQVDPLVSSLAIGVHVHDGVPYVCGRLNTNAYVWAGGQKQMLSSADSEAYAVLVYDSPIYGRNVIVAGRADDAGTMAAVVWINGSPVQLDKMGTNDHTSAWAVAFGPKFW